MGETTININYILNTLGISIPDLVPPNLPEPIEIPDDLEIELVEISGKLIGEDTREPLSNIRIFSPFKIPTKTDSNGEFTIKVPNISKTPFSPSKFQINVLGKIRQYSPIKITPYLSNKEVKPNLGIIPLTSIKSNLAEEIADLLTFEDREVEEYSTTDVTFEFWVEKNLSKAIKDIGDVTDKLMDLQKSNRDLNDENKGKKEVTNNNLFVGSTTDLQRLFAKHDKENKEKKIIDATPEE